MDKMGMQILGISSPLITTRTTTNTTTATFASCYALFTLN